MKKKVLLFILPIIILSACVARTNKEVKKNIKSDQTIKVKAKKQSIKNEKNAKSDRGSEIKEHLNSIKEDRIQNLEKNDHITKPNPPIDEKTLDNLRINSNISGIKTRQILNVKHQYQKEWNWCAPTAVSMMLDFKGISISQEQLANEMGTDQSFGTHNVNAIKVLNKHMFGYEHPQTGQAGYRLAEVKSAEINSRDMHHFKERLVQNIKDGYPLYYTFDVSKMYPGKQGEHNVVGIGYQLTGDGKDVEYVYYLDPSYSVSNPTYGGLKKVTPSELLAAMLTCVEPNYGW